MALRSLLARWRGGRRPAPPSGRPDIFQAADPHAAPPMDRAPIEAALAAPHGHPADGELLAAIGAEVHGRRARTGTLDGPPSPVTSNLVVRKEGLPDWWHANRNLLLCAPDVPPIEIGAGLLNLPNSDAIVVIGTGVLPPRLQVTTGLGKQGPGMIVIGDRVALAGGGISINGPSTVMIGEDTTATFLPNVTAHNGGMVLVGADGMWAPGVIFMTDDSHAILDLETGKRINRYGGRIVVGRHVWLGWQVGLMGDVFIDDGCVVGQGSLVRNIRLAANTMASGRPARALRSGVAWSREDIAPE